METFLLWWDQPHLALWWHCRRESLPAWVAHLLHTAQGGRNMHMLLYLQVSDEEEEGVTDTCHTRSEDSSDIPSQV